MDGGWRDGGMKVLRK